MPSGRSCGSSDSARPVMDPAILQLRGDRRVGRVVAASAQPETARNTAPCLQTKPSRGRNGPRWFSSRNLDHRSCGFPGWGFSGPSAHAIETDPSLCGVSQMLVDGTSEPIEARRLTKSLADDSLSVLTLLWGTSNPTPPGRMHQALFARVGAPEPGDCWRASYATPGNQTSRLPFVLSHAHYNSGSRARAPPPRSIRNHF